MVAIEVICRRCGKKAPADEFKVDHIYKLAVCRVCYNERSKNIPKKEVNNQTIKNDEIKTTKTNKTPNIHNTPNDIPNKTSNNIKEYDIKKSKILFDDDDEYLNKAVEKKKEEMKIRKENSVRVRYLRDNKVMYPCQNCDYKFKYDINVQRPVKCPYCGKLVNHNVVF